MNHNHAHELAEALFNEAGDALFLFDPDSDQLPARDVREQREAHARLEKAEAELRRVLASVSDCLWTAEITAAGRWVYRYCSPVVERLIGRPAEFLLGDVERWHSILHPDDR